jgi:sugar/nucleoside kinase (ribokinase family)
MKKFDKKVYLHGLVGDDFMGKIVIEWFGKYNVSEGIKVTKDAGTAFSIVLAPPGVDRMFLESPGCNQIFDTSCIDFDIISQSRLYHFGYPPLLKQFFQNDGSKLVELFSEIQDLGVVTSLDFSLPDTETESGKANWPKIMKRVLPFTDIFVPSLEEALQIILPEKYAEMQAISEGNDILDFIPMELIRLLGKTIIDSGVKILLLKMGHRGVYLLTADVSLLNAYGYKLNEESWNNNELWCETFMAEPSKIINATGAGDTAIAAFLTAILDGESAESSLKYAAMAGRNNLYCHNIYEELPVWNVMTDEINTNPKNVICLNAQ